MQKGQLLPHDTDDKNDHSSKKHKEGKCVDVSHHDTRQEPQGGAGHDDNAGADLHASIESAVPTVGPFLMLV
jgi:hypothetical protein